jgi:hypothetical protein
MTAGSTRQQLFPQVQTLLGTRIHTLRPDSDLGCTVLAERVR